MKKVIASLTVMIAMMAPVAAQAAQKIGVVNMQALIAQHPKAEGLQQRIQDTFAERIAGIQKLEETGQAQVSKLQKDGAMMNAEQRTKIERELKSLESEINLKGRALQEDMQLRSQEEQRVILMDIGNAIERVAKKDGYDMVLEARSVLWATDNYNISEQVLKAVQTGK